MGWVEVVGYIFKLVGQLFDMKAKGELSPEKLDAAIRALEKPKPPKE